MQAISPDEDLLSLYQEIILDHGKSPRNKGRVEDHACKSEGRNPLCGDRVTVTAALDGDTISDIRFDGKGCAISMASASMMTEALKGLTKDQATQVFEVIKIMCTGDKAPAEVMSVLGAGLHLKVERLAALSGVRNFPVRVKCATLPWHAFMACLEGAESTTTETERD